VPATPLISALVVLLAAAPAPGPSATALPPWEGNFMAAPAREVLAAAKAVPVAPGAEVVVLEEEQVRTFDADGKSRSRYRQIYLVLTEGAARDWDHLSAGWDPWYEEAPVIRARVISKDGRVSLLDPKSIEVSNPGARADAMYSDHRLMRAPLPAVAPGSVVETEVASEERAPMFDGGTVGRFYFGGQYPVQKARLVLQAPEGLALKIAPRRLPDLRPSSEVRAGLRVTTFEGGPYPARPNPPGGAPPEEVFYPHVAYSSGTSWNQVAARYAGILQRQLAGAELRALARETIGGAKGRDAQAARLLDRLSREVRYTGVEFGEASIVPHPPAEVLEHRYGDCKDKALLLVGLLRAAGIGAEVALLRSGFDGDIEEDLPGLGRFNHAIVYVPGPQPLWIDPTDRFSPLGSLPLEDQGRLALIARADSKGLVRTPRAPASANFTRETREVVLEEDGETRITERNQVVGATAQALRWSYANTERKKVEEQLERYVKGQYEAKGLGKLDHSDPMEVDKPFRIDLTVKGAAVGSVWDSGAQVILRRSSLFDHLPPALRDSDRDDKPETAPRTIDFVIVEPYQYEIRYKVVPPHGFAADALPPPEHRTFAGARLDSTYALGPDGSVQATMRFDSGPTRLKPAELTAFREAMKAFMAEDAPVARFTQIGEGHLAAGRIREALAEFRRLEAAHAGTVLHATQMAYAYLEAGLGEAARREARRAADLDPKSSRAQRALGWVLEHDLIGRRLKPGADPRGAERAYRKALELDQDDRLARASLAILLEYDEAGNHAWPRPHLREAAQHFERLRKEGVTSYDVNYLMALLHDERWKEVITTGKPLAHSTATRALVLAGIAMTAGPRAAIDGAIGLVPEASQRPETLRMAAAELMNARRYPQAAELFAEAAKAHQNGSQLQMLAEQLRRTRRYEELKTDLHDPRAAAKVVMSAIMRLVMGESAAARADLKAVALPEHEEEIERGDVRRGFRVAMRAVNEQLGGVSPALILDMLSSAELTTDGDPRWATRVHFSSPTDPRSSRMMVMVPRKGTFHLLCLGQDERALGQEALRLARAGDLAGARYLLDLAVEGQSLGFADDPLAAGPLVRIWQKGSPGDLADIELAAAAAIHDATSVAALDRCAKSAAADQVRLGCQQALIPALGKAGKDQEILAIAAELHRRYPHSPTALNVHAYESTMAGHPEAARAMIEEWLRARPQNLEVARLLGQTLIDAGDLPGAEATYRKLTTSSHPESADFNQLAWISLLRGRSDEPTIELARRAVSLSGRRSAAALHTLASLLAEAGHPEEAHRLLIELLEIVDRDEPRSSDWYVVGRIAEGYGLRDVAQQTYRRIKRPEKVGPIDVWKLVERRLAPLESAAQKP
jgi:tetratricopeptide (TPR) repeat protein/transglutaminase-like putative cysteine protease